MSKPIYFIYLKDFYQTLIILIIAIILISPIEIILFFVALVLISLLFYNKISCENDSVRIVKVWKRLEIPYNSIQLAHVRAAGSNGVIGTSFIIDLYSKYRKKIKIRFSSTKDVKKFIQTLESKSIYIKNDSSIIKSNENYN